MAGLEQELEHTLMNRTRIRKIFDKHCFFVGQQDVVNAVQTGEMFGHEAVLYAIRSQKDGRRTVIMHEFGENKSCIFLTYEGFERAAAYRNMENLAALYEDMPDLREAGTHKVTERSKIVPFKGNFMGHRIG